MQELKSFCPKVITFEDLGRVQSLPMLSSMLYPENNVSKSQYFGQIFFNPRRIYLLQRKAGLGRSEKCC